MSYFELRSPRDMLGKAERELARLQGDRTIDNIYNFFVTAYHVQDSVKAAQAVPAEALRAFLRDEDLRDCRAMCHKGKHFHLSGHPNAVTDIVDSSFGGASFGEVCYGEDDVRTLMYDGRVVDIESLPGRVIEKWRRFFSEHGL